MDEVIIGVVEDTPETKAETAATKAQLVLAQSYHLVVNTKEEYDANGAAYATLNTLAKDLEADRVSLTKPLNDTVKRINDRFRIPSTAIENKLKAIKVPMENWLRAEDAKRRQAEAEAQKKRDAELAEANRVAEEERQRLEQLRLDQEAAAKNSQESSNPVLAYLEGRKSAELEVEVQKATEATQDALRATALIQQAPLLPDAVSTVSMGVRANRPWKWQHRRPFE